MAATVKDLLTVATATAKNHQDNMTAGRETAAKIAADNPALGPAPAPAPGSSTGAPAGAP